MFRRWSYMYIRLVLICQKMDEHLQYMIWLAGGHSSLIGYETSKEFAKRGARVILPCRSLSAGAAAKDKLIGKA